MAERDSGKVQAEVDWREVARLVLTSREMDRLEEEVSGPYDDSHQVTNLIELPDGTRVTFVGSAENVVEAASRFLARRKG